MFFLFLITLSSLFSTKYLSFNYTEPKWIYLLLILILGLLFSFIKKKSVCLIKLNKIELSLISIWLFYPTFVSAFNNLPFFSGYSENRIVLLILVIFFFNSFKRESYKKKIFTIINLISLLAAYLCLSYYYPFLLPFSLPASFPFGNINLAAQFAGLGLISAFFSLDSRNIKSRNLPFLVIFISSTFLLFAMNRSVYLALVCASFIFFVILCLKKKVNYYKSIIFYSILACSFSFITFSLTKELDIVKRQINNAKLPAYNNKKILYAGDRSVRYRLYFWKKSIEIANSNFFGVGDKQFNFSFNKKMQNNQEKTYDYQVPKTPHNEFMRALSENGWLYFFLLICIVLYALKKIVLNFIKEKNQSNEFLFSICILIFIGIESLFQFPFLNVSSNIFFALAMSLILSELKYKSINLKYKLNILLKTVVITILLVFFLYNAAKGLIYTIDKSYLSNIACKLNLSDWNTCIYAIEQLREEGKFRRALDISKSALLIHDNNHPIIREQALTYLKQGNIDKACESFELYKSLYFREPTLVDYDFDYFCYESEDFDEEISADSENK